MKIKRKKPYRSYGWQWGITHLPAFGGART